MANHWNSKYAILCDLSVAQGRQVPAEISNTVAQDERPPRLMFTEETEEEFFGSYAGGGDCTAGPDLELIQQMLEVPVRRVSVSSVLSQEGHVSQQVPPVHDISKPPSPANVVDLKDEDNWVDVDSNDEETPPDFPFTADPGFKIQSAGWSNVSTPSGDSSEDIPPEAIPKIVKKPNRNRNVAVNSLLEIYRQNENQGMENGTPCSDQRLQNSHSFTSTEGVSNLVLPKASTPRSWLPTSASMFKKKATNPRSSNNTPMLAITSESPPENRSPNKAIEPQMFVPSSRASEYYNKYVEKSKLQDKIREDIWSQAERKMKEIDAKRNMHAISPASNEQSSETHGMDTVRLSQHRHELSDKCVVCEVLCESSKVNQKTVHI